MTQLTTLSDDPFFRLTGDTEWNACIGPQGHEENYVDGYMEAALKDQPERLPDPPEGIVKVGVSAGGRLLPNASGGITEWVKVEDLQRMEADMDTEPDYDAQPTEEAFDIF